MKRIAPLLRVTAVVSLALVVTTCRDTLPPGSPSLPNNVIVDGAHTGNEHFFFLPPLTSQPATNGVFDGSLAPVVEICAAPLCGVAAVVTFTTTPDAGAEGVHVDLASEQYSVNWHTNLYGLNPAVTYRIRVVVGGTELGYADVDVVSSGSELKRVDDDLYIPLLNGRTLPIKFRIEVGAVAPVNQAPVVGAGDDQSVTLPGTATLNGSVTDDGLPSGSTLAITWSKVSGPGTVTFGDAAIATTTASFSGPGEYVLRLAASDGELTAGDEVTITVAAAPSGEELLVFPRTPVLDDGDVSLPDGVIFASYPGQVIGPSGTGTPPYSISVTQLSGGLPAGLNAAVENNGTATAQVLVAGTPSAAGRDQFRVEIVDGTGASASLDYDIRVNVAAPSLSSVLTGGNQMTAGYPASRFVMVSGGTLPLTYAIVSGSLPGGMSLNSSTGAITGTPDAAAAELNENGTWTFTAQVSDALTDRVSGALAPRTDTQVYTVDVRLSYASNILPVRANGPSLTTCTACHGPALRPDFALADAAGLINIASSPAGGGNVCPGRTYVVPGSASNSLVYGKVATTPTCGVRMPPGTSFLSITALLRLARWINEMDPANP